MIYITGDTHNTEDMSNLSTKNMKLCCMEQGVDFHDITHAIVLGDFGLPWSSDCEIDEKGIHPADHTDRYLLKWYNQKPFKILAVQGNHDNYDVIEKLSEVKMFGSKVLKVSDNIFYLKRGEIYCIEGNRYLVLGGAMSDDKAWRKPHESWWEQEEWSEEEKSSVLSKIETENQFDYVLSHTGSSAGIALTDDYFRNEDNLKQLQSDSNVAFNDKIDSMISYKKWFFGHWHSDWGYENYKDPKFVPLYHQGIVIKKKNKYKNMCRFFLISEIVILVLGIFSTTIPLFFGIQPIKGYTTIIGFIMLASAIAFNLFISHRILYVYEVIARFAYDSMNRKFFDIDDRLNSREITKEQAEALQEEVRTELDESSLFSNYAHIIHLLNKIAIISIICAVILKSLLLRKPAFFWSHTITITCCLIESCLFHLFSDKDNVETILDETKNLFRNIFKGKITANSKVLYFKQFLSDYSVHMLDSKFYCSLRFGNLLKDKGDLLLCPLGNDFRPANPLSHWVVEREGKYLKDALKNLDDTEYDKTEFSVFIPCKKLHYKGIIFVCVDFHSENCADINAKRIADAFLLAKKQECKKLSCPIGFLYEGFHPDSCKEFFAQFDKVIRTMDEDAKKIDYLIEFVIKRNLENYSMFKDYQDFFE